MPGRIRVAGCVVLVMTALLVASCAKLPAPADVSGGIPGESLASRAEVPAQWGELVSVSSAAAYPDLVQLWFRATDGTVRYAVVSLRTHEILNVHVIRRTPEAQP